MRIICQKFAKKKDNESEEFIQVERRISLVLWHVAKCSCNVTCKIPVASDLFNLHSLLVSLSQEYRGAGTTDGTFRNHLFFACQQDCGVFVPITRIKKRYQEYNINKRHYIRTSDVVEVDSALGLDDIYAVNQRVRLFTDEGEKEGHVLYCGFPPGAKTEYVGIEIVRRRRMHHFTSIIFVLLLY